MAKTRSQMNRDLDYGIKPILDRKTDPNEDHRLKGTFWTYWNRTLKEYDGPEIDGSVLAYTTQTPTMGKITPNKVGITGGVNHGSK